MIKKIPIIDPYKRFIYDNLKQDIELFRKLSNSLIGSTEIVYKIPNAKEISAISHFIGDNEVTDFLLGEWFNKNDKNPK